MKKYQINHKHINLTNGLPLGNQFEKLAVVGQRERKANRADHSCRKVRTQNPMLAHDKC